MSFNNMKIPVENNLDEIVGELEKRGYVQVDSVKNAKFVVTYNFGYFVSCGFTESTHETTTLAKLKEM